MNQRTRGAVAAFVAMVAFASAASAEGTAGKGSLGGIVGVPYFLSDSDTKDGQRPRLLGQAQFQYAFSERTRLATSFGYGWIGYKDGTPSPYKLIGSAPDSVQVMDDVLTKFQPITVSILRALKPQGAGWVPYVGAGINLTRIEIVNERRKIKDPETRALYVNWAPGLQAQVGTEHFLGANQAVSFDWHVRYSHLFSKDETKFPSGFTGPHSYVTANFGVNVYFWPIGHKPIEVAPEPEPAPAAPAAPEEPAAPETPEAPEPTPDPAPDPPTPGARSSVLWRPGAAPAADAAAACPARPTKDVAGGMFGVPGATSRDHRPEGGTTP